MTKTTNDLLERVNRLQEKMKNTELTDAAKVDELLDSLETKVDELEDLTIQQYGGEKDD